MCQGKAGVRVTLETVRRRRVAIVDGERRLDLVVPVHNRVAEALHAAGVDAHARGGAIVETAGREVDPSTPVGDLSDGAILMLVEVAPATGRGRRRARARRPEERPAATWWALAGAGAILAAVALLLPAGPADDVRMLGGLAAAAAAVAAGAVHAVRLPAAAPSPLAPVVGVLVLAFAGGVALVPPMGASGVLAVLCGALLSAAVAGMMGVLTRSATLRAETRTALTVLLVIAGVWGLALLWHGGPAGPAAVTLGLVPVGLRILLSSLVDVPPGTFIDYTRFQTTRWTVRQQMPEEIHSIDDDEARSLVARSTARLVAGAVLLVAAGAACAPVALPGFATDDPLVLAGRIALGATVVLALLLGARKMTVPALRWVSRGGAFAVLVVALIALIGVAPASVLALVAGIALALGAASAFLVVPAGRGVRSLAWSRFGDTMEWIAIALSLPAALLAADAVDVLRGMMAA
jgi:hypothetical protein